LPDLLYFALKFIHVLGAIVILGTGAGIAFFMLMAHASRDVAFLARTARVVVIADAIFTATAVILQPISGYFLAGASGYALTEGWLLVSLMLYVAAGIFWLPVVWLQIRMRDLAEAAVRVEGALPDQYFRYFRIWFLFGIPGFGFTVAILWLMIAKPF
jgi:uncharacterized membrane protein